VPTATELAARFPPADPATFKLWFPGLALSKTSCDKPRCDRTAFASGLPCFHLGRCCLDAAL